MGILLRQLDGREVLLSNDHVVGRMPSCGLTLSQSFVSLAHALIRWNGLAWELRDLGSTNGTYANGRKLTPGEAISLSVGASVAFGNLSETWRFMDATPPTPAAIPLDGGEPRFLKSGVIALPDSNEPIAVVLLEGDRWVLESHDSRQQVSPGAQFLVAGRQWRLECPAATTATSAAEKLMASLADARLVLRPSLDEEHVTLSVHLGSQAKHFNERTCFYLLLVLARLRTKDEVEGAVEPGWIEVQTLLRMIPDYGSAASLNVDICRLRRLLYDAGMHDASRIVDRRRGELRLGIPRVEVQRLQASTEMATEP